MKPHVALLDTEEDHVVVLANGRLVYWENPEREDCDCYHEGVSAREVARDVAQAFAVPLFETRVAPFVMTGDTVGWYRHNHAAIFPETA